MIRMPIDLRSTDPYRASTPHLGSCPPWHARHCWPINIRILDNPIRHPRQSAINQGARQDGSESKDVLACDDILQPHPPGPGAELDVQP